MSVRIGLLTERECVVAGVAEAVMGRAFVERLLRGGSPAPGSFLIVDWVLAQGDEPAGGHDAQSVGALPVGVWDAVVCCAGETQSAMAVAHLSGAEHLITLPEGAAWLADRIVGDLPAPLMGVRGLAGGVGATTVAIACAASRRDGLLVDADALSDGLTVPLGLSETGGARLADLPDSGQALDPPSLRAALPRAGRICVAAGAHALSGPHLSSAVSRVVTAGREHFGAVIIDSGRGRATGLVGGELDVEVLVAASSWAGASALEQALLVDDHGARQRIVILRETSWMSAGDVHARIRRLRGSVPPVLVLPRMRRLAERADCSDLLSGRLGAALVRFGERVWEAL